MEEKVRPQALNGVTPRIPTGHGNLYVTLNFEPETNLPFEMFATVGKAGGCEAAHLEGLTRLISLCLRSGISAESVVHQLRNITCHPFNVGGDLANTSPTDAIAMILERSYNQVEGTKE